MSEDSKSKRMLRGREPLTVVRRVNGPAVHVYFSSLIDPASVDPEDRERLIAEKFLEWVKPDGESWVLADDRDDDEDGAGAAGDPVTVSAATISDPERDPVGNSDPGNLNSQVHPVADSADTERADARAKLPTDGSPPDGRASKAVWVEYAVKQGMDRTEAEKADKADLVNALKP